MAPANRPSRFGGKKIPTRKISHTTAMRRKFAEISAERRQAAIKEILAAYKPGWGFLHENYRKSLHGIALGLSRQGLVTNLSDVRIVPLLKELAAQRKIKLPKMRPKGGSRKK